MDEAVWIFRFQEYKACVILKTLELSRGVGVPFMKGTVNLAEDLLPRIALKFSNFLLIS